MGAGDTLIPELKKIIKNWDFIAMDSQGMFGELIFGWNSSLALKNSFSLCSCICTKFWIKGLGHDVRNLNLYNPYVYKQDLWDRLFALNLLKEGNLIIGEDLNIIMNNKEVWGKTNHVDHLVKHFLHHF
jgi:hypothetical protein